MALYFIVTKSKKNQAKISNTNHQQTITIKNEPNNIVSKPNSKVSK
jgi:hypothetical protein